MIRPEELTAQPRDSSFCDVNCQFYGWKFCVSKHVSRDVDRKCSLKLLASSPSLNFWQLCGKCTRQPMYFYGGDQTNDLNRLMTKPTKSLCAQRRLRSDWANQSLLCTQLVAKDPSFLHADSEGSDLSLCWVHMLFCWFCHEADHLKNDNFNSAILSLIHLTAFYYYKSRYLQFI